MTEQTAEERRAHAAENPGVWRVGQSPGTHGRNIYRGDEAIGVAFDPADAAFLVDAANGSCALRREVDRLTGEAADHEHWQNELTHRIPESYDDDGAQESIIETWLDDLQELAKQVAPLFAEDGGFEQAASPEEGLLPYAQATLDMEAVEKFRALIERLEVGERGDDE